MCGDQEGYDEGTDPGYRDHQLDAYRCTLTLRLINSYSHFNLFFKVICFFILCSKSYPFIAYTKRPDTLRLFSAIPSPFSSHDILRPGFDLLYNANDKCSKYFVVDMFHPA